MKGLKTLSLSVVLTLLISAGSLYAGETKTSGYASVDVMSNYVWRGQKLSNSWVIQPSAGITYNSFGTNIWANYDSDRAEATETDLTLNYSFSVNKFNFAAGYIYYALEGADDTQEVYFSANYDTFLKPALTVYYDYDEGDGTFILASVCHSFGLSKDIALNLGVSASYNINNKVMGFDSEGYDFNNFYNGELFSFLGIPLSKAITLTPKIAYSFPLSNDAKNAIKSISDDGDKDIFYGGINMTLSF